MFYGFMSVMQSVFNTCSSFLHICGLTLLNVHVYQMVYNVEHTYAHNVIYIYVIYTETGTTCCVNSHGKSKNVNSRCFYNAQL